MTLWARLRGEFLAWIQSIAEVIVTMVSRFRAQPRATLVETSANRFNLSMDAASNRPAPADCQIDFTDTGPVTALPDAWKVALRGSRLELRLIGARFLSRPLDLPKRAGDFLEAMVRSQIDRLTPWTAAEAIFAWTAPVEAGNDRINLTVIATPRGRIAPLVGFAEDCEVSSVAIYASPDGSSANSVDGLIVLEKRMRGSLDVGRVHRILCVVLLIAAGAAAAAFSVGEIYGGRLESERSSLTRQIAERRAAMRLNLSASGDATQNGLVRRKRMTPSSVMVLEALSTILPDNTYVTELRIEKDKLQLVGVTQDAPSLVKLIEQSPHFTRATFFAPTTRSANDPGDRFHVEARIRPYFGDGT
jgi:general secretion pathway protein L